MAAIALVSALAVGCGRSEEEEFRVDKLRPLVQRAETQKSVLSAELRTSKLGSREDARELGARVNVIAGTYRRIAALDPPSSVRREFDRYVEANARMIAALRRFTDLLTADDQSALNRAAELAQEAVGGAQRAQQALQDELAEKAD